MNSIRQKLQMGYIIGFGSLWILCGLAVYFSYRAGLLAGVESELYSQIRVVRMTQMKGMGFGTGPGGPFQAGKVPNSMMDADLYWHNWPMNEGVATRSENLTIDLPRLNPDFGENLLSTQYLENGITVMMVGGRFGMGDRGAEITVARNLAGTHSKLKKTALGITFAGIVFGCVTILWVFHIIRTGLAPIKTIANQVNAIDTDSLGN